MSSDLSSRAAQVAQWFGLPPQVPPSPEPAVEVSLPLAGQILLITGASGSGKSTLLRALRAEARRRGHRCIDLARIRLPHRPVVDLFRLPLDQTLRALARVGLAEAHSCLLPPARLSDGQRWRLRLALALHRAAGATRGTRHPILIADEFAALLDRITAAIVAHLLRRAVMAGPLSAMLATARDDLGDALAPDRHVRCDFGQSA